MSHAEGIEVSARQRAILERWVQNRAQTPVHLVERSRIILLSAEGMSNAEQARQLGWIANGCGGGKRGGGSRRKYAVAVDGVGVRRTALIYIDEGAEALDRRLGFKENDFGIGAPGVAEGEEYLAIVAQEETMSRQRRSLTNPAIKVYPTARVRRSRSRSEARSACTIKSAYSCSPCYNRLSVVVRAHHAHRRPALTHCPRQHGMLAGGSSEALPVCDFVPGGAGEER